MNPHAHRVASRWLHRQAQMQKFALKQRTFMHLMNKGGNFGIISAYSTGSKKQNQIRHGELMADLQKLGYRKIHTLKGQWEGVAEKSLLIQNIKPQHLFMLGAKYGQDAVIYKSRDGVVGMYYPAGKYAEVAVDPAMNPAFDLAEGQDLFSKDRNWSFDLGFMWGKHIPWSGRKPLSQKDVATYLESAAD